MSEACGHVSKRVFELLKTESFSFLDLLRSLQYILIADVLKDDRMPAMRVSVISDIAVILHCRNYIFTLLLFHEANFFSYQFRCYRNFVPLEDLNCLKRNIVRFGGNVIFNVKPHIRIDLVCLTRVCLHHTKGELVRLLRVT